MPSTRAQSVVAVGLAMKPVGKPDAGNPHVRFDERGRETGHRHRARPRTRQVKGRKRHILTDTVGHLVTARVHAADIQDRDGRQTCWPQSATCFRGCAMSLPTAVMPATS